MFDNDLIPKSDRARFAYPPGWEGLPQRRSQHVHAGQTESGCPLGQKRMSVEVPGKVTCDFFWWNAALLSCPARVRRHGTVPNLIRIHTHPRAQTLAETYVPKAYYVPSRIALVRTHLRPHPVTSHTRLGGYTTRPPTHTPSPKCQSSNTQVKKDIAPQL